MTIEDALQILALPPDAPPNDLRRAYLRAVKRHSPESDPEGFRRVRAAYELLGAVASAAAFERLAMEAAPSNVSAPVADEPPVRQTSDPLVLLQQNDAEQVRAVLELEPAQAVQVFDLGAAVRAITDAVRSDDLAAAIALHGRVSRWLDAHSGSVRFNPAAWIAWRSTTELMQFLYFEAPLRRAVVLGEPLETRGALEQFCAANAKAAVRRAATLRKGAPILSQVLAPFVPQALTFEQSPFPMKVLAVLKIAAVVAAVIAFVVGALTREMKSQDHSMRRLAEQICTAAREAGRAETLCIDAFGLATALERKDCDSAGANLRGVDGTFNRLGDSLSTDAHEARASLARRLASACPSETNGR